MRLTRQLTKRTPVRLGARYFSVIVLAVAITVVIQATGSTTAVTTYDEVLLASIGALGLNLLIGTAGQLSIASGAFLGMGAFTVVWAGRAGIPVPFTLVLAVLVSGGLGAVVGLPGARLRGLEMALATVAAYFVIVYILQQYESSSVGLNAGFTLPTWFEAAGPLGGVEDWAWLLVPIVLLAAAVTNALMHGKAGRALRLIRDHQSVAATQDIPVVRYKLAAFSFSSALLGLAGALMGYFYGFVDSGTYTLDMAIGYVAMVIIGGLDSVAGAIIGAAIVTALPTVLSSLLTTVSSSATLALDAPEIAAMTYGVLLLLVLVKAPGGIAGLSGDAIRVMRSRFTRQRSGLPPTDRKPAADGPPKSAIPFSASEKHSRLAINDVGRKPEPATESTKGRER
jgi:branched-chain amino acid transport system permease protein